MISSYEVELQPGLAIVRLLAYMLNPPEFNELI
jgi:hypothetical protein